MSYGCPCLCSLTQISSHLFIVSLLCSFVDVASVFMANEANWRYDVYLCFRGHDTRRNFARNLYHALCNNRFRVFMDDGGLKSGDQIVPSFIKAIEDSRIAIVVLSDTFASSRFCLDELVKILECEKKKNQLVYPVFHGVDPSAVRDQTGSYGDAMDAQKYTYGRNSEKVHRWKSALTEVANLSGRAFCVGGDKYEYEFIQDIVQWVTRSLPRYDVFLSFSWVDTRYSFTGYLYNALRLANFQTFMNDEALDPEDQISTSLINAIEKSRLSIIIFSENYGYSSCCLDQLVKILECMEIKKQMVWPIFYKVEPSDLRHQKNSHGKAMAAHENRFGKDSEKVRKWRSALFEVANLKGWHFKTGYEYEFIERMVENAIKN